MADTYPKRSVTFDSDPFLGGIAFTGSADVEYSVPVRGVYIGTAGHLQVDMADGTSVTFSNLLAGTIYWIAIRKIYDTGTTAAGVVLY